MSAAPEIVPPAPRSGVRLVVEDEGSDVLPTLVDENDVDCFRRGSAHGSLVTPKLRVQLLARLLGAAERLLDLPKQSSSKRLRRFKARGWDCGNPECLECAATIARRQEAQHLRVVQRTAPWLSDLYRSQQWMAECSGKGERRTEPVSRPYKKPNSTEGDKPAARTVRILTKEEEREAFVRLSKHHVRDLFDRDDWHNEVWIELLNPPLNAEPCRDFVHEISRAVGRAQIALRGQQIKIRALCTRIGPKPSLGGEGQ